MTRSIILASQSPRRVELLSRMGLEFQTIPSDFDERLDNSRTPQEVAIELAVGKATTVAEQHPDCVVIGADTIVEIDGEQLEKPHDSDEALAMLKRLSGTHNEVSTSLAIICKAENIEITGAETTRVYFKPYNDEVVRAYVATGDPLDKAGAYGIQSGAGPLIDHIEGNFDTVMGLPTHTLARLLAQIGIQSEPVDITHGFGKVA